MTETKIYKAIAAFLTGMAGIAANFLPGIEQYVSPEFIAATTMIATTFVVWLVPNPPKETKK